MIVIYALIIFIIIVLVRNTIHMENIYNRTRLTQIVTDIDRYNANLDQNPNTLEFPIFYINMDKHIDRKKYMETQFENIKNSKYRKAQSPKLCLGDYYRIPGFNGYNITNKKQDKVDNVEFVNEYRNISKSEIGCTMSHILAIKKAYDMGVEVAMICEDDLHLGTYSLIPKLSSVVSEVPKDWDIIQLATISFGGLRERKYTKYYKKNKGNYIYVKRKYPTAFWGTSCYLINRNAMKKLLDRVYRNTEIIHIQSIRNNYPYRGSADVFIYDIIDNCYSIVPSLFITNNTELESTIHTNHTNSHIAKSLVRIEFFHNMIRDKIPLNNTVKT